ncbi:MAG TPA: sodium:solute symporter family protein [Methanotrichaceae archaeon]|nr:sodium:solute symporter family protein [Methanotrichaceae archaeon]HQF17331.1 sodium:solute symporter family protein [Methanotrichaceae archaeon]HQI91923.1 sodium:solute symporter family protein [Methanotrichaceae archaeon]HQJ29248.1 sodium:solute symporter family protein [Methanotrichaceae archaeon]
MGLDPYLLFMILLGIYVAVLIVIGIWSSRRQGSVTEFWLAGRELGAITIGFAAAASWLTASALLLATGLFLFLGLGSVWIWVFPNIAGLVLIAHLASRIRRIPAMTQPELLEIRYDPVVRAPVALAIAIMMVLFSVVDFIGFKLVLQTFFGVPPAYAIAIMAVSVAAYVSLGGFRAVVWTDMVQYSFLAALAIAVAFLAVRAAAASGTSLLQASASLGGDWWNPFLLGGVAAALVYQLALLPGWVAEQDPWQKVWAARDLKAARGGLLLGAALLALVYAACLVTAIALRAIYPLPDGEMAAEMLYLQFISDSVPPAAIAFLTIGFAAASMSCTDTFATSGASCLSRDIIQRFLRPQATMREMLIISRVLVVLMIAISALVALNVESIMDAVIMATVIGTTSYFFPIVGGLYWKRATKWGALAAVVVGGGLQIMIIAYESFILKAPVETLFPALGRLGIPLLVEHGVLVGLSLSGLCFVGISILTKKPDPMRLAPFFSEVAEAVLGEQIVHVDRSSPDYSLIQSKVEEKVTGARAHLNLKLDLESEGTEGDYELPWDSFVRRLKEDYPRWYTPTGSHIVYRLSHGDMLSCIKMVRGGRSQVWLSSDPAVADVPRERDELFLSAQEIDMVLSAMKRKA